jgi:hypothetical protein
VLATVTANVIFTIVAIVAIGMVIFPIGLAALRKRSERDHAND